MDLYRLLVGITLQNISCEAALRRKYMKIKRQQLLLVQHR